MSGKTEAIAIARMLEIIRISDHEWRIADRTVDESSGTKVIGFMQEVVGGFESTRLGACPTAEVFDSFDRALRYFVRRDEVLLVSESPTLTAVREISGNVET